MARKRKRTPQSKTKQTPFGTLREYTTPSIFGPVSVTDISTTPEQLENYKRFLHEKIGRREKETPTPPRKPALTRLTADERTELARKVLSACIALAHERGEERVVSGTPITEVHAGRFMIWLTAWNAEVSGLDVWLAAEGGKKLLNMRWSKDEVQILTFKHALAWAPELIALAPEKVDAKLH